MELCRESTEHLRLQLYITRPSMEILQKESAILENPTNYEFINVEREYEWATQRKVTLLRRYKVH